MLHQTTGVKTLDLILRATVLGVLCCKIPVSLKCSRTICSLGTRPVELCITKSHRLFSWLHIRHIEENHFLVSPSLINLVANECVSSLNNNASSSYQVFSNLSTQWRICISLFFSIQMPLLKFVSSVYLCYFHFTFFCIWIKVVFKNLMTILHQLTLTELTLSLW